MLVTTPGLIIFWYGSSPARQHPTPGRSDTFFRFFQPCRDNSVLSPLVRIQVDRQQRGVSTGIHGFVRHPMYSGAILMFVRTLPMPGSCYGLFPGFVLTVLLRGGYAGKKTCRGGSRRAAGSVRRKSCTGLFRFSGSGSNCYRIPVSMDISSRTVSPLWMVTVAGSSGLPPIPWCRISITYVPGFRETT